MGFQTGHKLAPGGSRPGAGRKTDAIKREFRALLEEAMPREKQLEALVVIANFAHAGKMQAAEFMFDRLYGKPTEVIEIETGEEAQEAEYDLSLLTPEELTVFESLLAKTARTDEGGAGKAQSG